MCLVKSYAGLKPTCRFEQKEIRALQNFLHVAIPGEERVGRERDGYFRQTISANSSESRACHADDGETHTFDLQHLPDYVGIPGVMALPEIVGEHCYRRG